MAYTKPGTWGQKHIATILGLQETSWSKLLNGQIYPARLQTMQKIEVVFGWPVSEQVQLIPYYWEWPGQPRAGVPGGDPVDLRYAIKLGRVVAEWADANPRTVPTKDLKLHPSLTPINGEHGPRFVRKDKPEPEAEPEVQDTPFVASKSPLAR